MCVHMHGSARMCIFVHMHAIAYVCVHSSVPKETLGRASTSKADQGGTGGLNLGMGSWLSSCLPCLRAPLGDGLGILFLVGKLAPDREVRCAHNQGGTGCGCGVSFRGVAGSRWSSGSR
jgi:hypothetical protein